MNSTVFNKELYVRQLHDNNLLNMKSTKNYFYHKNMQIWTRKSIHDKTLYIKCNKFMQVQKIYTSAAGDA